MHAKRSGGGLVTASLALAMTASVSAADAQAPNEHRVVERCFSSAEAAQPLMRERQLVAAQRLLLECAREECPKAARADCRTWLDQVTRAIPTVVLAAHEERPGAAPRALEDVRVVVDGRPLASRLDGTDVPLDPGHHELRFEHAGFDPVAMHFDLHEGERREIEAVFRRAVTLTPPPIEPPAAPAGAPVPVLAWGLAGTSVLALGAGITMEVIGLSDRAGLVSSCKPTQSCSPSAVNAARGKVAAGDVLLGAGGVLLVGAAYVYFTRDPAPGSASGSLRLRIGSVASATGIALEGAL
jgi:hypothetical protein